MFIQIMLSDVAHAIECMLNQQNDSTLMGTLPAFTSCFVSIGTLAIATSQPIML